MNPEKTRWSTFARGAVWVVAFAMWGEQPDANPIPSIICVIVGILMVRFYEAR